MNELLKNIADTITFRPEEGPFRAALVAKVLTYADAEHVELFSADNCDIHVSVSGQTLVDGFIRFLVNSDLGEQSLKYTLAGLTDPERTDFRKQLAGHSIEQRPSEAAGGAKVIVRKASSAGMFSQQQAADRLGFSLEVLRNRIPCTDYSYDEIDGKKFLREFYWSQTLIERLQQIKASGAKPEDVKYVAAECCFGDSSWAEELLASLHPPVEAPKSGGNKNRNRRYPPRGGANHGQSKK